MKDIKNIKRGGTLNSKPFFYTLGMIRHKRDLQRIEENKRFVNKLVNAQPVIQSNKLSQEYNRQKYLMKQISQNSNKYYHSRYFYEDFNTVLSPDLWEDKAEMESAYISSSPAKETMNTSLNLDTSDAYGRHTADSLDIQPPQKREKWYDRLFSSKGRQRMLYFRSSYCNNQDQQEKENVSSAIQPTNIEMVFIFI